MIKHTLIENLVHVSIENVDFSYRIPLNKLGNTVDWRIGEKDGPDIKIKKVSKWTLQLFTKKVALDNYLLDFKGVIEKYKSENSINWESTFLAVAVQNEYNRLKETSKEADKKSSEAELISTLKKKYKLD
jgi:hypothetical protein